jgi:hypothetical protein
LIEYHHLVDGGITSAIGRVHNTQKLRRSGIRQIDYVNTADGTRSKISPISDYDGLEELEIRARIVMAVERRSIGV